MQPKQPILADCHACLSTMQEKIRLRLWEQLEQASHQFSAAMVDLTALLQTGTHDIAQQELVDLSFQQRRTNRMLHNAMLSNRNEMHEVEVGLRHLKERQAMLKGAEPMPKHA